MLGNHDYESGTPEVVCEALTRVGVRVLDGEACEIEGVGIAGAKGFAGGFGRGSLGAWGEPAIKLFVQEALHEAMKLESALAKLRTPRRIALLHYSPIAGTVAGEPVEIFPFLGSSRLEEPLLRYPVDAVFHGHAHRGTLEGKTINGVPVYNVARPLLQRTRPGPAAVPGGRAAARACRRAGRSGRGHGVAGGIVGSGPGQAAKAQAAAVLRGMPIHCMPSPMA